MAMHRRGHARAGHTSGEVQQRERERGSRRTKPRSSGREVGGPASKRGSKAQARPTLERSSLARFWPPVPVPDSVEDVYVEPCRGKVACTWRARSDATQCGGERNMHVSIHLTHTLSLTKSSVPDLLLRDIL